MRKVIQVSATIALFISCAEGTLLKTNTNKHHRHHRHKH